MAQAHTLGRGLGCLLLLALLAFSGNSVGCHGTAVRPGRASAANQRAAALARNAPPAPALRQLDQHRLSLAASVAENAAKDAELCALRRQLADLQSRHDALVARAGAAASAPVAQTGWELLGE